MRAPTWLVLIAACSADTQPSDATQTSTEAQPVIQAAGSVLTQHNDMGRTGLNPNETQLTQAQVTNNFGELFEIPVDGRVYAQPLFAVGVATPLGTRDVLYVATANNTVYAFDAYTGQQIWSFNAGTPIPSTAAYPSGRQNITPKIGITGTPVIDPTAGVIYFVAATQTSPGVYRQSLHARYITDGSRVAVTAGLNPRTIIGSVDGTDANGNPITLAFDPLRENQRPGLLLKNGKVYIGWGGHYGDLVHSPAIYEGWIMSFDATSLAVVSRFTTATHDLLTGNTDYGSGIWMSGTGLASDGQHIYIATGNGRFNDPVTQAAKNNWGDAILKLDNSLNIVDYFSPSTHNTLDPDDLDLGAGGIVIPDDTSVPGYPDLLTVANKWGDIYLLDRTNLGHLETTPLHCGTQAGAVPAPCGVGELVNAVGHEDDNANGTRKPDADPTYYGAPAYFNNRLYYAGWDDSLKRFMIGAGSTFAQDFATTDTFNYPGATPSISANGATQGIVWAIDRTAVGPWTLPDPAHLRAYSATNLSRLFSTTTAEDPDQPNQFMTPTIAGGHVYVAGSGVNVYGLLLAASGGGTVARGNAIALTLSATPRTPAASYTVSAQALPAGVTATYSSTTLPTGGAVTVTLHTSVTTPPGNYTIELHGTTGHDYYATVPVTIQ